MRVALKTEEETTSSGVSDEERFPEKLKEAVRVGLEELPTAAGGVGVDWSLNSKGTGKWVKASTLKAGVTR